MARTRIYDLDLPPRCSRRNGKISYRPPTGGRITFHDLPRNATPGEIWKKYEQIIRSHRPHSLQSMADSYFQSVSYVLKETRTVLQRARELTDGQRQELHALPDRLSSPEAMAQLLQSIDEAPAPRRRRSSGISSARFVRPHSRHCSSGYISSPPMKCANRSPRPPSDWSRATPMRWFKPLAPTTPRSSSRA